MYGEHVNSVQGDNFEFSLCVFESWKKEVRTGREIQGTEIVWKAGEIYEKKRQENDWQREKENALQERHGNWAECWRG